MTSITWQIDYMNVSSQPINGETEVVLTAGWRCTATENGYATSNYGSCSFPNPTSGTEFIPYSSLTQSEVLDWCYANGVNKEEVELSVSKAVSALVNPPTISPALPWVTQNQAQGN
jgi:hypothetical protein